MPTRRGVLVAAAIVVLFLIANRAAYEGYFSGDDLDNLQWTSRAGSAIFVRGLLTPLFNPDNFRPVGHAFFWLMGPIAKLRFAPYLAVVQGLHLVVTLLIYLLARRLGASEFAALAGSMFFIFHMALFDAFWKPMYVFDVLCALFCCLSVLAWLRMDEGRVWWLVSFVCFWLAYKSKEVAVMLPAVVLVLELRSQPRRWQRVLPVIPSIAVSLMFGLQAMVNRPAGEYHLAFTPESVLSTVIYYGSHALLHPWGLLVLIPILLFARNRFGAIAAILLLAPMLALPDRTFAVYLYVPLAFLALCVASAAERSPRLAAVLLAAWLGGNFVEMRHLRSTALAEARPARIYVDTVAANKEELSRTTTFGFDGYPEALHLWGALSAVGSIVPRPRHPGPAFTLSWQPGEQRLYLFDDRPVSFLDMSTGTFIERPEQTGWYAPETDFRWTHPTAKLALKRPSDAKAFEWKIQVPPAQLNSAGGTIAVETQLDGKALPVIKLDAAGWKTVRTMDLPATGEMVNVELRVTPPFRPPGDRRELGVAIGAIGFR